MHSSSVGSVSFVGSCVGSVGSCVGSCFVYVDLCTVNVSTVNSAGPGEPGVNQPH